MTIAAPRPPAPLRIALIGVGKIARDRHVGAITADPRFDLVAAADPAGTLAGVPTFESLSALLANGPPLDAVAVCTPPAGRGAIVAQAIAARLHVLMEKPPATTLSEIAVLRAQAATHGTTLFAAWHSREAGAVAPARAWLAPRRVQGFAIVWHEDIRRWHPGQDWILAPGGFGVFDPGINALSILTAILSDPPIVDRAAFTVPHGRHAPIAAQVTLRSGAATGSLSLDFLERGTPRWEITVETDAGVLVIADGGRRLTIDGAMQAFADAEYPALYARFHALIAARDSDVDAAPCALVADAFVLAEHRQGPSFAW